MYSDGYKIKEIVDYLNEHNIRTYRNGKMTINIVQRMLSNRRYIGEYKFQKTVVPNGIPAIISEELFNRVQEILAKNKRSPARKSRRRIPFNAETFLRQMRRAYGRRKRDGNFESVSLL